ncbi:hypothetical protein EV426DRAFT_701239 [Tirmania nivea]|nr:hypothetical protein EV426DRAFT_701239 [Tirmania nivea]
MYSLEFHQSDQSFNYRRDLSPESLASVFKAFNLGTGLGYITPVSQAQVHGDGDVSCRACGRYDETGHHLALVCGDGEWLGRRFGSWEDADNPSLIRWREQVDGKSVTVDLAEAFFARLRSY